MNSKFRLFLILLCGFIIISCEDDNEVRMYEILHVKDGKSLKVRTDTCISILEVDSAYLGGDKPLPNREVERLYRFIDVRRDSLWIKAKFGRWCIGKGLNPDSVYLVQKALYSQMIADKEGYLAVPYVPNRSKMGFMERKNRKPMIGYSGGTFVAPLDNLIGNCWTVIYHVGYDVQGNKVDVFIPCNPDELEWYYYLYHI